MYVCMYVCRSYGDMLIILSFFPAGVPLNDHYNLQGYYLIVI